MSLNALGFCAYVVTGMAKRESNAETDARVADRKDSGIKSGIECGNKTSTVITSRHVRYREAVTAASGTLG
jgi:hypothetical protein